MTQLNSITRDKFDLNLHFGFVIVVAVISRLLPLSSSFSFHELSLIGGPDAFYHLRRAELLSAGSSVNFDAWTNYPWGTHLHWPVLYSWILSFFMSFGSVAPIAFFPIASSIITIIILKRWTDEYKFGNLLLLLISSLPAFLFPTVLGAIDHHCLELLFLTLALYSSTIQKRKGNFLLFIAVVASFLTTTTWPIVAASGVGTHIIKNSSRKKSALTILFLIFAIPIFGWDYFRNPWLFDIEEAKPLINSFRDLFKAIVALSPGFLFIIPASIIWWKEKDKSKNSALLSLTAIALPLALLQRRFILYLVLPSAFAFADILKISFRRYPKWLIILFTVISVMPVIRGVSEITSWQMDPSPMLRKSLNFLSNRGIAGDWHNAINTPQWCAVAEWDLGNHILLLGKTPVMANAFHNAPEGRACAHRILYSSVAESNKIADENKVRYLFLTDLVSNGYTFHYKPKDSPETINTLYGNLYFYENKNLGWSMVYHSSETFEFEGRRIPLLQIWERIHFSS
ncbi:MAG: hypothetical protein COS94_04135 [Candidatus Hydrogenedentes bacterium CG07_land_8_20_14_0_80_42_17]|nr:MAG: hypothetical protein COS94_04135 [Candidatus Hydrogenedentes bacterium CG07_land_8_20_14_0_80_42_17]